MKGKPPGLDTSSGKPRDSHIDPIYAPPTILISCVCQQMTRLGSKKLIRVGSKIFSFSSWSHWVNEEHFPSSKLTKEAPETHSLRCRGLREREIHPFMKMAFETDLLIHSPVPIWARDENQWGVTGQGRGHRRKTYQSHLLSWHRYVNSIWSGGHIGKLAGPEFPYYYLSRIQE